MRNVLWTLLFLCAFFPPSESVAKSESTKQVAKKETSNNSQATKGDKSPAVSHVTGDVNINYYEGVDPRALKRLLDSLDQKDLEISEKNKIIEEWVRKYTELSKELDKHKDHDKRANEAKKLLQSGDLEGAERILRQIEKKDDEELIRIASNKYSLALILSMQFKPVEALPYFKKAYELQQENNDYAFYYAKILQEQKQFKEAVDIYEVVLSRYRALAKENPSRYLPYVADTLNNLGVLYKDTNRRDDAENAYKEAVGIFSKFAEQYPSAYGPYLEKVTDNLRRLEEGKKLADR